MIYSEFNTLLSGDPINYQVLGFQVDQPQKDSHPERFVREYGTAVVLGN